jgi:hypothetical protein
MIEKIVEGKNVSWVVNLHKQIDDYPLFMDTTAVIEDAIRKDINLGYESEKGPHYAIEVSRIDEYVNYVSDKLNRENYYRFDTRNYRFFLGSVPIR